MSTIDSQTILTYPTYFARQGIQSINIDIVTTMDKETRNKSNIFSKQTGHEDKSKDKGNRMSREKAKRHGSTVHYMFRREKRQKIVGGNPRDIKMRSFGKDK